MINTERRELIIELTERGLNKVLLGKRMNSKGHLGENVQRKHKRHLNQLR